MPLPRLAALLIALSALTLAACGEKDEPDLGSATTVGIPGFQIEGTWSGELQQAKLEPFTVTATIADLENPAKNTVTYTPPIDCSGNWAYLGQEGTAYRFRETITGGKGGDCKGKGIVTLNPFDTNGVDYDFQGGGVSSAGVLKRTEPPKLSGRYGTP
jgi:hypothetical protein